MTRAPLYTCTTLSFHPAEGPALVNVLLAANVPVTGSGTGTGTGTGPGTGTGTGAGTGTGIGLVGWQRSDVFV